MGKAVVHEHSTVAWGQKGREQQVQAVRLARLLIAQTLAYFSAHESKNINLVCARLMDLVDARPSVVQGQNLRSAHMLLGRHAERFNRALQTTLSDGLKEELKQVLPLAPNGAPAAPDTGGLDGLSFSLLDVNEVERVLLLDRVAQRFCARYDAALESLNQRIAILLGREGAYLADNPFKPLVLIRAFMQAWDQCELDPQAADDLLLSLDPQYWFDLKPLYAELNATLEKAGVEAQRELRIKRSMGAAGGGTPSASAPWAASDSAPASLSANLEPQRSAWGALAPAGRTVAAHARQFLQRLGFGAPASQHSGDAASTAPAPERPVFEEADPALMGYLGNLQAGASATPVNPWVEGQNLSDHNVLRQMREQDEIRRAPELDRGTVDALAEVFDFVFADQAIPLQMKMVIGRLQIPVLKAAMIDRDFFLSDQHPARRLVDTLAGASVAWAPEKGENDPLYSRIEQTVQRVLNEFEDDLALFADLLRDFSEFLFETEQQAQAQVEPTAQKEHKGEAWEQALSDADEWIHARIEALSADTPLAPFLLPFLSTQWREVLARAQFDEPTPPLTTEQAHAQAQVTMDRLIWSTQPKTTPEQRKELVAILPDLVRQLNQSLDAIGWDGKPRADFTRRLITTHTQAIRFAHAPAQAPVDSKAAELEASEGKAALQKLDERRAARHFGAEDEFDAQAQALKRGVWFEVTLEQSTKTRSRLSWVSPMRTRFLFTNREGFDAFVRSEREVAAMLRLGTLHVLDAEPIVGRALNQIMVEQELRMAA